MKISSIVFLALMVSSCTIYKQKFDCPPDPGIPCTSVSDLEQMIIETEQGPDIFLPNHSQQHRLDGGASSNRIWVVDPGGDSYYIYLYQGEACQH